MGYRVLVCLNTEKARIVCLPVISATAELVTEAGSESELRDLVHGGEYNAVILEDTLSWGDAFSTCTSLRATVEGSRIPVLVFSIHAPDREKAFACGASGFLSLPFDESALEAALEHASPVAKTILFVDDSMLIHKMIDAVFSGEHYRIVHAGSGKDALSILKSEDVHLVVTDIEMPEMNGFELCRAIKTTQETAEIPVIIQSSLSSGVSVDSGFEAGADDYITKPIVPEELVSRVRAFLETENVRVRETILVIDDSAMIRRFISRGLSHHGFIPLTASDGSEALTLLEAEKPDLVIVDQEMPVMNGSEFVRHFREVRENGSVPVVMLSGRDSRVDRARRRSAGVTEFIAKPFTVERLLAAIERLLAEARFRRERDAMRMYVSDAVRMHATAIAESGTRELAMRAEEQFTTILFTDIVGFTSLCESLSPPKVVNLLNAIFDILVRVLTENGAVIDKFIGDAIMALFGGGESGAYLAVKAGLEMNAALAEYNAESDRKVHIRVGINSGTVVMGDIGSEYSRRDYTVIGDAVNVAQRLESVAQAGTVLISEATQQLLGNQFATKELDPISVKGKEIPVKPYLVETQTG